MTATSPSNNENQLPLYPPLLTGEGEGGGGCPDHVPPHINPLPPRGEGHWVEYFLRRAAKVVLFCSGQDPYLHAHHRQAQGGMRGLIQNVPGNRKSYFFSRGSPVSVDKR